MAIRQARTESGLVSGVPGGNNNITVFKSIPYAAPPVGDLRFRAPKEVKPWNGIYQAHVFRPIAAQAEESHPFYADEFYGYREEMSEDCLYLSVWTPAQTADEGLSVMMFIHGGGYQSGYHYEITVDGEAFARQGVILVSIDYRLGVLGFLAHKELRLETGYEGSGNWGTLDQIAALKWIRRNIAAFGGDPERITVFGQSAGAMSVENLVTSPLTKGDISGAIMQSAGGYVSETTQTIPMLSREEAELVGEEFIKLLGVASIAEARMLPWETIVEAQKRFCADGFMFSPVVDCHSQVMKTYEAIDALKYHDIPYMIGANAHENGENRYCRRQSQELFLDSCRSKFGDLTEQFLDVCGFYENPELAIDQGGMNDMIQPAVLAWCEKQAESPRDHPTWLYYFDRELPGERPAGAYHSAELWYVFHTVHRCRRPLCGLDFDLSAVMNRYWCNFAKTGNPNDGMLPNWHAYTKDHREGMEFGERIGVIEFPGSARSRFITDFIMNRKKS